MTALTQQFLRELREKHDIENAILLVNYAKHLHFDEQDSDFRRCTMEIGMLLNVFFRSKASTSSFSNSFSHVQSTTAEMWLQAFAVWWNSLN
jgi:putative transposase